MKTQPKSSPQPTTGELSPDDLVTYALPKLLQLWQRNELTPEQMMGHLFQHLFTQEKRLTALERGAPSAGRQGDEKIGEKTKNEKRHGAVLFSFSVFR